MKFRYLSHMRKVKLKIACTMPSGVRGLKIGQNSLPQACASQHVFYNRPRLCCTGTPEWSMLVDAIVPTCHD